jgi:hypothetical protein
MMNGRAGGISENLKPTLPDLDDRVGLSSRGSKEGVPAIGRPNGVAPI